ncbi:carboxylesterase family protein [Niveispirillum sp. BGYR6]|uniref:carboxylesterase/lipase family protein n=1 Tax=Niveispirillum sp. BGYR6 TaxID=2971249 RepID=UPI0022B95B0C|nr:carboxylesterase family protein [Niveispirillum sp. BGYR6]MDG5498009.1 carboxylesterase family protein [Niveispirillum sp. BGYR6]
MSIWSRLLLGAACLCLPLAAFAQTVKVEGGVIEGKVLDSGVNAFLGVPFAAPPLRDLRWRPPQPVAPWKGTFHADRFAPMCLQPMRGSSINHYFGHEAISEDCLYLNVWAPAKPAPPGKPYPVMVWIYGGAFNVGSASMPNYSGEFLAKQGVIYVALSYRVGTLGFLAHPELTAEGGGHSGNYGLMDQIQGLRWVRDNIAGFGGDPGNVTLVGQSAGSMSIGLLLASPAAKGLFHRAVGMSGSPFGALLPPLPLAEAEADGQRLQEALKTGSLADMRAIAGDRIIATPLPRRSPIVLDGKVLPLPPDQAMQGDGHSDVPVMIGFTRDESFRSLGRASDIPAFQALVQQSFPGVADKLLKAYAVSAPADIPRAISDIQRDATVGRQVAAWAQAQKQPAYIWLFTRRHPYTDGIRFADHDPATVGAYHTGDVPYWLGTLEALNLFRRTRDWQPLDLELAARMQTMLLSFARDGKPAPDWPRFDPKRPRLMELGEQVRVVDWPRYGTLDLLAGWEAPPPPSATPSRVRD